LIAEKESVFRKIVLGGVLVETENKNIEELLSVEEEIKYLLKVFEGRNVSEEEIGKSLLKRREHLLLLKTIKEELRRSGGEYWKRIK